MTTVKIAGQERSLQPWDANRTTIVGGLVGAAIQELQSTALHFQELQALSKITVTEEDLANEEFQTVLDQLEVPAEDRKPGLQLDRQLDAFTIVAKLLPVAMRELPELLFDIAAAMLIPNEIYAKHATGSGGKNLEKVVREAANRLRFGTEQNEYVGISEAELLEIVNLAAPAYTERIIESAPLAMEAMNALMSAFVPSGEEPSGETSAETSLDL